MRKCILLTIAVEQEAQVEEQMYPLRKMVRHDLGIGVLTILILAVTSCGGDSSSQKEKGEQGQQKEKQGRAYTSSAANLGGANLGGANLGGANPGGANLGGANPGGANRLVFATSDGERIWTINPNGSNLRPAMYYEEPDSGYSALSPEWSPNGKKILFTRLSEDCAEGIYAPPEGSSASSAAVPPVGPCIYVMNADGSDQKKLVDTPGEEPSLSPDGTKIAFQKGCAIYIMNSDGSGTPTKLISREPTRTQFCYLSPEWSPDGKKIAVSGPGFELYIVDASAVEGETKEPVKLTNFANAVNPAWSPDSSEIAFSGKQRRDPSLIYKMNADGSGMTRLANRSNSHTSQTRYSTWPAWSPDGKKIAYVVDDYRPGVAIYVMNSDGSDPKLVKKIRAGDKYGSDPQLVIVSLDWG